MSKHTGENPINPSGPASWDGFAGTSGPQIAAFEGSVGAGPDVSNTPLPEMSGNLASKLRRRRRASIMLGQLALAIFIVGGWQLCTSLGWVDKFFYGQPTGIVHRLYEFFAQGKDATSFGSYPEQIWVTFQEAVYGFLLGAGVGVIVGVALGVNEYLSAIVSPYIKMLNAIPRIVLGAIFVVAFGVGLAPKIYLAAVLVFFVVFFNAYQGSREVDQNVIANARVLGAKPWDIVRHVTLPSAMTWIIASLHTAFGFAIVGALVQEILGSTKGLGLIITTAEGTFDANGIMAVVFTVMVLTLIAEFILTRIEHRLLAWRPQARSEAASI